MQFTGTTYTPPAECRKGRRGLVIGSVLAFVVLAAAGTAIGLSLAHKGKTDTAGGAVKTTPATSASARPSAAPAPMPVATMLVREDTPGKAMVAAFSTGSGVSTAARHLILGTVNGDTLPRWSHDGEKIALTHNTTGSTTSQLFVMNKDGSDRHKIADGMTGKVAWSADDTKVAYFKPVNGVAQLFVSPVDGSSAQQLTHAAGRKDDPVWTPDGARIVYWATVDGVRSIFALNATQPKEPGDRITPESFGDAIDPAISPDGTQVLLSRVVNPTNEDVYLTNMDGSGTPKPIIVDAVREQDPTWSPDGKWFAFSRGEYQEVVVVAARIDGSGLTTITPKGSHESQPCWA